MFPHNPPAAALIAGWAIAAIAALGFISVLNRAAARPLGAAGKGRLFLLAILYATLVVAGIALTA